MRTKSANMRTKNNDDHEWNRIGNKYYTHKHNQRITKAVDNIAYYLEA